MKKETVRRSMVALSTIKKNLVLNDLTLEAWTRSLELLSDDQGVEAFSALMRSTIYGDVEPGHVIEAAKEAAQARAILGDSQAPWISQAPIYQGSRDYDAPDREFASFLKSERKKFYRSMDRDGAIFLVRNPEAWEWSRNNQNQLVFERPTPIPTGEKIEKKELKNNFNRSKV